VLSIAVRRTLADGIGCINETGANLAAPAECNDNISSHPLMTIRAEKDW
jgi:hypothetical protein